MTETAIMIELARWLIEDEHREAEQVGVGPLKSKGWLFRTTYFGEREEVWRSLAADSRADVRGAAIKLKQPTEQIARALETGVPPDSFAP